MDVGVWMWRDRHRSGICVRGCNTVDGEGSRTVGGFVLLTARRLRIEDMFVWGIYRYNCGWWGVMSFFVRGRVAGFVERDATIGTAFGRIWCVGPCAVLIFPLRPVRLRCSHYIEGYGILHRDYL